MRQAGGAPPDCRYTGLIVIAFPVSPSCQKCAPLIVSTSWARQWRWPDEGFAIISAGNLKTQPPELKNCCTPNDVALQGTTLRPSGNNVKMLVKVNKANWLIWTELVPLSEVLPWFASARVVVRLMFKWTSERTLPSSSNPPEMSNRFIPPADCSLSPLLIFHCSPALPRAPSTQTPHPVALKMRGGREGCTAML